jgi:DNA-binding GntR family transcriptional regulator
MGKGPPSAVVPQYVQIAGDLRSKIKDGTYGPGSLLPSRNEIIAQYGVSAITARDALSMICHEGFAKAVRGRGHIVRRKRSRLTVPGRMYSGVQPDPNVPLELSQLDVYFEQPPDNIALPLEADTEAPVWVRRAVSIATDDRQPIQIHVSWITGLTGHAEDALRDVDPAIPWPETVQRITGRTIATVLQNTRARGANPFESGTFGIPDATIVFVAHLTTYDPSRRAIEHSRYTWPTDAVRLTDYYSFSAGSEVP